MHAPLTWRKDRVALATCRGAQLLLCAVGQTERRAMAAAFAGLAPLRVLWKLSALEIADEAALEELHLGNNTKVPGRTMYAETTQFVPTLPPPLAACYRALLLADTM